MILDRSTLHRRITALFDEASARVGRDAWNRSHRCCGYEGVSLCQDQLDMDLYKGDPYHFLDQLTASIDGARRRYIDHPDTEDEDGFGSGTIGMVMFSLLKLRDVLSAEGVSVGQLPPDPTPPEPPDGLYDPDDPHTRTVVKRYLEKYGTVTLELREGKFYLPDPPL